MTAQQHVDAVKALLGSGLRYHEGDVPDGAQLPYVVLFFDDGRASRTTLATVSDRQDWTVQVTSVGADPAGARSVRQRAKDALLDKRPTVAGRLTWSITHDVAEPVRIDRDVTPHLHYGVDVYAFASVPAPA